MCTDVITWPQHSLIFKAEALFAVVVALEVHFLSMINTTQ